MQRNSNNSNPPWQVKWKRPRWDHVVVGIDAIDAAGAIEATDGSKNDVGPVRNNGNTGDNGDNEGSPNKEGTNEMAEKKSNQNKQNEQNRQNQQHQQSKQTKRARQSYELGVHWIPVSSSSAVLTRSEARMAILELHRRGKLLVRRSDGSVSVVNAINENRQNRRENGENNDISGDPTPKNKNRKRIDNDRYNADRAASAVADSDSDSDAYLTPPKQKISSSAKTPPPSFTSLATLASPSTWFKSPTPTNTNKITKANTSATKRNVSTISSDMHGTHETPKRPPKYLTSLEEHKKSSPPTNSFDNDAPKTSPSSPTSFSTFSNILPPPSTAIHSFPDGDHCDNSDEEAPNASKHGDIDDDVGGVQDIQDLSPPTINNTVNTARTSHASSSNTVDASTASSLLWEDMTLTSVSEEDAAVFLMYGNKKRKSLFGGGVGSKLNFGSVTEGGGINGRDEKDVDIGDRSSGIGERNVKHDVENGLFAASDTIGGGKYYYDRHGNVRISDWDGFDNVVFSATVFATSLSSGSHESNSTSHGSNASDASDASNFDHPTSGDIIVLELLSTRDPPPLQLAPGLTSAATAAASAAISATGGATSLVNKQQPQKQQQHQGGAGGAQQTHQARVSPSSSSSMTGTGSSSGGPSPSSLQSSLQLLNRQQGAGRAVGAVGAEVTPASSGGDDSSSHSNPAEKQNSFLPQQLNGLNNDKEEEEKPSNHTRILARRVLRWPTSVLSQTPRNKDFPSFVALGRTNVFKERKRIQGGGLNFNWKSQLHKLENQRNTVKAKEAKERATADDADADEECEEDDEVEDAEDERNDNDNDFVQNTDELHGTQQHSNLVSDDSDNNDECLNEQERAADALDAVQSLNFLFGRQSMPGLEPVKEYGKSLMSKKKNSVTVKSASPKRRMRKKLTQPLSLCFVTSDGQLHSFHALSVLLSRKSRNSGYGHRRGSQSDLLTNSFAAFLLGPKLHSKVCEDVCPLSHPRASLRLSQMIYSKSIVSEATTSKKIVSGSSNPIVWEEISLKHQNYNEEVPQRRQYEEYDGTTKNDWSDLSTFDASIDSNSLPHRTLPESHVLTDSCITSDTSNSYVAVCGKGLRRVISCENPQKAHLALGGFLTLISLRHCSESRTIYLPFAPKKVHPINWQGMHFVVLLGEKGPYSSSKVSLEESLHSHQWGEHDVERHLPTRNMEGASRLPYAMMIRVDCKNVIAGTDVSISHPSRIPFSNDQANISEDWDSIYEPKLSKLQRHPQSPTLDAQHNYIPTRFRSIQILLPSASKTLGMFSNLVTAPSSHQSLESRAIAVSSIPSSPPGILMSFQWESTEKPGTQSTVVVNHTMSSFQHNGLKPRTRAIDEAWTQLHTFVRPGHSLMLDSTTSQRESARTTSSEVWCASGQGWSIFGFQGQEEKLYFVSWDGASEAAGPFFFPLQCNNVMGHQIENRLTGVVGRVMPLISYVAYAEKISYNLSKHFHGKPTKLPFTNPYIMPSFLQADKEAGFPPDYVPNVSCSLSLKESIRAVAEIEGGIDDVVINALESISTPPRSLESLDDRAKMIQLGRSSRMKSLMMSHAEKSKRLLRHCASWTELDDKKANRAIVQGQVIMATIRFGSNIESLTMRSNVYANPITTPFHQILAWLCQRKDYFTAASVALSLLNDVDAVYELQGIPKASEGEPISYTPSLLDGITPLFLGSEFSQNDETQNLILTSLADMTVGCLIKGGTSMASTLEGFLARNKCYDASRACLMLVGTTAAVMSESDPMSPNERILTNGENIIQLLSTLESPREDFLWPVRCLLRIAVVRNCLPTALLMLNVTIPNELRWRAPRGRGPSAPRPCLSLCLSVVDIILESSKDSTRYFLNLVDEETNLPYWSSIGDDTRLALSLLSIHGKHVLILEPEVREWALIRLKEEIESPIDLEYSGIRTFLPNEWLKELVTGAFCNSECDIGLGIDAKMIRKPSPDFQWLEDEDEEVTCYRQDMLNVQNLLIPQKHTGGLDFDLLIASLLVLLRRDQNWREGTSISTQILLNSVCDLAGRKTDLEPKFIFDGSTVMRQCALAGNLQAAAFLIGGRNGLILECADIIISYHGISMKEAESALFTGSIRELETIVGRLASKLSPHRTSRFKPGTGHRHLMWLLQEHVLNVRTYGEFNLSSNHGKIDPVFAGRVCFRAWYCLTQPSMRSDSANWLEEWLRRRLELVDGQSHRRLACAGLVRSLLWADEGNALDLTDDEDEEPILASLIGFDGRFMAELANACCGLIEAIPPHVAEEIMSGLGGSSLFSFDAGSILNVAKM